MTSAQNAGTNCAATTVNGKTEYWGNNYSYDAWGNLLAKSVTKCSAENLSVTALANNQLSGYSYDAAGNMMHDATSGWNYSYDQENRITGAAGYTYTYDGDGNRVKKSNGSTGTLYWYLSPGIVAESDLNGNLQSEYVFFDGERIARKDFPSGAVSYYFSDHLKTASVITDAAGNIKEDEDYYPWGGELQFVNNDSNHYKFTGKERDSETGLYYFGARYYSNGLGRFITPDWAAKAAAVPYAEFADPQSLNLYEYVRNIPTTNTDKDGHDCWTGGQCVSDVSLVIDLGVAKGAANFFIKWDNGIRDGLNKIGGHYEHIPELKPSNEFEAAAMPVGEAAVPLALAGAAGRNSQTVQEQPVPALPRLPQDEAVNPTPPPANNGNGTVGPSPTQNAAAQADVAAAKADGHTDIRMNQQQTNADGVRVGQNRPDLQTTDKNGLRHYTEYDRSATSAADHAARTQANDPNGVTHTKISK